MRKLEMVGCALAMAFSGCAIDSGDEESLEEVEQDIEIAVREDTLATTTPTRNAVVYLAFAGKACTGTLIAPDVVLTAAHCGFDDPSFATGEWTTVSNITVWIGPVQGSWVYTANANQVSVPRLATAGPWLVDDIALVKLTAPVPSTHAIPRPTYVDRPVTLSSSSTIYQVGYGAGRNRRYMTGSGYRDWLSPGDLLMNAFEYVATENGDGIGTRGTNVENGDSGGPMLLGTSTGYVIGDLSWWNPYGIATFGPGGEGRPSIKSWIQAKAPQKPDFDVIAISASGCTGTGGDPTIRVTVKNRGVRSAAGWVDVFADRTSTPPIGTLSPIFRTSGTLAPEQTLDMSFALPGASPGAHRIDVLMDTTRSHDELSETNNTGSATVTLPDCSFN